MSKLSINDLSLLNLNPLNQIFVSWMLSNFDNNSAIHRRILNIEPLSYQGTIAGSEFLTYAITKLYLCLELQFTTETIGLSDLTLTLYNENNVIFSILSNQFASRRLGGSPQTRMCGRYLYTKNFYFSRFVQANILYINFQGYRITLN